MFSKKSVSVSAAAVLFSFFILGFVVLGSKARADWHEPRGLVGTWRLQLTPAYCPGVTTGTLAAPFQGLVSFTGDGTLINTFNNALFGYETPGHGYWWKTDDRTYKDVFELLIVAPPATSQYVAGTQKSFANITLDDENDFTAQVMAEYFNASGTVYLTKCIDVAGTRLNDSQTQP
ncbi:MAG TPA: hypothetical protein VMU53_07445 [Candidatus Sulfotelmatobacter sp.]|nr:hypothetical protein [Candidatus Sulfotelmatobacter sp.]